MSSIAVSLGDPAGIGPEIVVKAWARRAALRLPDFFVVGDRDCLARAAQRLGASMDGLRIDNVALARLETPGKPDSANGEAARPTARMAEVDTVRAAVQVAGIAAARARSIK